MGPSAGQINEDPDSCNPSRRARVRIPKLMARVRGSPWSWLRAAGLR
jgi:hypothetical protein